MCVLCKYACLYTLNTHTHSYACVNVCVCAYVYCVCERVQEINDRWLRT